MSTNEGQTRLSVQDHYMKENGELDFPLALSHLRLPEAITETDPSGKEVQLAIYSAAEGYPSNFSSDGFVSGMLTGDPSITAGQFVYTARNLGTKKDPITGEEPGKAHHEIPGVALAWRHDKMTTYSRGDITGLFLLAAASLAGTKYAFLLDQYRDQLRAAAGYIRSHVKDGLFYEDPAACGADMFALSVTYWKDSILNCSGNREPVFPIVYSVMHFINAKAAIEGGKLLQDDALTALGKDMMVQGIKSLWEDDHFIVAINGDGRRIDPPSSDSLYSLAYISPDILPDGYAQQIEHYMQRLETPAGYVSGRPVEDMPDDERSRYHSENLWVHEQGVLHMAAVDHGLEHAQAVCSGVMDYFFGGFPEILDPNDDLRPVKGKRQNLVQMFALAAYVYFKSVK